SHRHRLRLRCAARTAAAARRHHEPCRAGPRRERDRAAGRGRPAGAGDRPARQRRLSPPHDRGPAATPTAGRRGARGMSAPIEIGLTINGRPHRLEVAPNRVLADLLREELQLTGCKIGCDQALCGACTVLVDGNPTTACTTFAFEVEGRTVLTIEGL